MKAFLAVLLPALCMGASPSTTQSPEAQFLGLPAGADELIGRTINTDFSCVGRIYGYYADVANACKVFHVCQPQTLADGQNVMLHYSFVCPTGQTFAQDLYTCVENPTTDCAQSENYYYLNQYFGTMESIQEKARAVQIQAKIAATGAQRIALPKTQSVSKIASTRRQSATKMSTTNNVRFGRH